MPSSEPKGSSTICEIRGCNGEATATRWVFKDEDGGRQLEVCWKHAEGDLDPKLIPFTSQ